MTTTHTIDVEAERRLFEAVTNGPLGRHGIYTDQYANATQQDKWSIWLAAKRSTPPAAPVLAAVGVEAQVDPHDVIDFGLELAEAEGPIAAINFLTAWQWESDGFLRGQWPAFAEFEAVSRAKGGNTNPEVPAAQPAADHAKRAYTASLMWMMADNGPPPTVTDAFVAGAAWQARGQQAGGEGWEAK